ncbi:MAG: hypothetical protein ABW128_17890, partial [Rhizorhabdus sp.]
IAGGVVETSRVAQSRRAVEMVKRGASARRSIVTLPARREALSARAEHGQDLSLNFVEIGVIQHRYVSLFVHAQVGVPLITTLSPTKRLIGLCQANGSFSAPPVNTLITNTFLRALLVGVSRLAVAVWLHRRLGANNHKALPSGARHLRNTAAWRLCANESSRSLADRKKGVGTLTDENLTYSDKDRAQLYATALAALAEMGEEERADRLGPLLTNKMAKRMLREDSSVGEISKERLIFGLAMSSPEAI